MSTAAMTSSKPFISRKQAGWIIGVVFVASFIANIPAALLYGVARGKLPGLELIGLQGSWTNGEVAGITRNARLTAQDLHYRMQPLQLLLGRIGFHLEGGGELAQLEGNVSRSYKATRISNMAIKGNLKRLAGTTDFGFIPLDAHLEGKIDELVLVNNFVDSAEASLDLKSLAWTLAATPMPLGDFHAEVKTTPTAIVATITSPSGPLDAKGEAKLFPDRRYELDVLIKLKPGASEMLSNYVRSLGTADAQGYTHLKQKGKL